MKIKVADYTGFCFGVKRAIKLAEKELSKGNKVYSMGPIIHNPQVVGRLSKQGLAIVKDLSEVNNGLLLIPSHGKGPALFKEAKARGLSLIDTTCPFVRKSQELVKSLSEEGYKILIVGEKHHPEISSLVDCAGGRVDIIAGKEEAEKLELKDTRIGVITQTTLAEQTFFDTIAALLKKTYKELRIFNTICNETTRRQEATKKLAREVSVMLVIGGRNSANTSRLVNIAKELGKEVYHIEDTAELEPEWFKGKVNVGISSGASTPDWIIRGVIDWLEKEEVTKNDYQEKSILR